MNKQFAQFLKYTAVTAIFYAMCVSVLPLQVAAQKANATQKSPRIVVTDNSWEVSGDQIEFGEYAQWARNLPAKGAALKGGNKPVEIAAYFDGSTIIPGTQPIWRRHHASDNWETYLFRKTIKLGSEPIKSVILQVNCDDAARVYINQKLVDTRKLNVTMGGQHGGDVNFKQLTTFMYNKIETYDVTSYFFTNTDNVVLAEVMNQPFGGNHAYLSAHIKIEFLPEAPPQTRVVAAPATPEKPVAVKPVATPAKKPLVAPPVTPTEVKPVVVPATRVFTMGSDATIEKLKVGDILELGNIFFKTDRYQLDSTSFKTLSALANLLKAYPNLKIEVGGHTNLLPDPNFANQLSENRAKAVFTYLTEQTVPATQVVYKGYGKTTPKIAGTTLSANRQNQRVEIKVLAK